MQRGQMITVASVVWIYQSVSSQTILNVDDCFYVNHVRENYEYRVQWTGNYRGIGCHVTFSGYDESDMLDEYKICIKAVAWDFYDPSVVLKYYSSKSVTHGYNDWKRTYKRSSSPSPETEWCSESKDYVSVKLENSGTSQGNITLRVYGIKTIFHESLKDSKIVGIIVGTIIGALLLLGIILTIVIAIYRKRRKRQSGLGLGNQNAAGQVITRRISNQQGTAGTIQYNISTTSLPLYEEVITHADKYMYRGQDSTTPT